MPCPFRKYSPYLNINGYKSSFQYSIRICYADCVQSILATNKAYYAESSDETGVGRTNILNKHNTMIGFTQLNQIINKRVKRVQNTQCSGGSVNLSYFIIIEKIRTL